MQYIAPIPTEQLFLMADKNKKQQANKRTATKQAQPQPKPVQQEPAPQEQGWLESVGDRLLNLIGLGQEESPATKQPAPMPDRKYKGLRDTIPAAEAMSNPKFNRFPYAEMIAQAAERFGINPYMLGGVVMQESSFNPRAGSKAGAQGLAQLIPETFRDFVPKDVAGNNPNPFDPRQSVNASAAYLDHLMKHPPYSLGDIEALRAYNQGVGRRKTHPYGKIPEGQKYPPNVIQRGMMMGAVPADTAWVDGVPYPGMYGERLQYEANLPGRKDLMNQLVKSGQALQEYATMVKPEFRGDKDVLAMMQQAAEIRAKREAAAKAAAKSAPKKSSSAPAKKTSTKPAAKPAQKRRAAPAKKKASKPVA